jgi:hypothetical protein
MRPVWAAAFDTAIVVAARASVNVLLYSIHLCIVLDSGNALSIRDESISPFKGRKSDY